ncbi:MAG TPA: DUF1330 domain-containing protein [Streptosporangiaceae bacterium]|nr:DUF1330 domain-containing protein [Streptosporangiaceae bacterium]
MPDGPLRLCVLLWAHAGQEDALTRYENAVLKLVAEHGGRVHERGRVEGGGEGAPTEVQFLEFPGNDALTAYMNDPRRLALAADRDVAVARTDVFRVAGP